MGGGFSKARIARFRRARLGGLDFDEDEKLVVPPSKRADLERLAELFPTLPRRTLLKFLGSESDVDACARALLAPLPDASGSADDDDDDAGDGGGARGRADADDD